MKIAILGFDNEGRSSYEYFRAQGHDITICDQKEELAVPDGVATKFGSGYLDNLDAFDMVVRTAGMPPRKIFEANPGLDAAKVTTQINEFFRACPTANIIGVTGTKGKGTSSTLIAGMLQAAGFDTHLAGNIGLPALELLPKLKSDSWVVLELSSYQLSDARYSPHIAVCLLIMPEHMDWHITLEDYVAAKANIFTHQSPGDIAVSYAGNERSQALASQSAGKKLSYFAPSGAEIIDGNVCIDGQVLCQTSELKLLGEHNWQNVCAAVTAVWQVTQDVSAIRSVLTTFSGLPFRLEFRREVRGVRYYNDSFASAPPATAAALRAITQPKVIIIGGYERGLDLMELVNALRTEQDTIRHILLIGASRERTAQALRAATVANFTVSDAQTMPEIVAQAERYARPGDVVLLSPGFASFDMFKNFEDRGNQFNEAVEKL